MNILLPWYFGRATDTRQCAGNRQLGRAAAISVRRGGLAGTRLWARVARTSPMRSETKVGARRVACAYVAPVALTATNVAAHRRATEPNTHSRRGQLAIWGTTGCHFGSGLRAGYRNDSPLFPKSLA